MFQSRSVLPSLARGERLAVEGKGDGADDRDKRERVLLAAEQIAGLQRLAAAAGDAQPAIWRQRESL